MNNKSGYRRSKVRSTKILLISVLLGIAVFFTGLYSGYIDIGFSDIFNALFKTPETLAERSLFHIRIPRTLGAVLGGAGFAASGMVLQLVLRNPLASPSTLGISQGAAFGAALGIMLISFSDPAVGNQAVLSDRNPYLVTLTSFFFSLLTTICILFLASFRNAGKQTIILAGVAISAFFVAATAFIQYFADETQLSNIVQWTFGDVGRASWNELGIIALTVAVCVSFFFFQSIKFNALLAGDDIAGSLGVNVKRFRMINIVMASLITSVIVTFFGVISFIGLIAPHIARLVIGGNTKRLLPLSMITGAILLTAADIAGRMLFSPVTLPAGIITAFMGTPIFLFLLFSGGRAWR